jgi:hypothetical protein
MMEEITVFVLKGGDKMSFVSAEDKVQLSTLCRHPKVKMLE